MMNCLFCKKPIPDGSAFCNHCGRKQERKNHRLPNGSGTVYKRGQTYTAQIQRWNGTDRVSLTKGGFKTKREALAYVPELISQVTLGKTERIGFCELWERLQETERYKNLSEDKKGAWGYAYRKCGSLYSVKDMREIRYEHLQSIVQGMTFYPARDVKTVLSAMYQLAMKLELADKNYAEMIELPKLGPSKEKEIFTEDEIMKIWDCDDSFCDYILIMTYCGLRPVEMRKLRTEDIHLEERYMTGGQKTEHSRKSRIAIPTAVVPILKRFKPVTYGKTMFERYFSRALKNAGIERELTPGCCRHTFVTWLTETEDSAAVIQKAARHTKYQTTLGYTHLDIGDVQEAVDRMADNIIKLPTNHLHSASND